MSKRTFSSFQNEDVDYIEKSDEDISEAEDEEEEQDDLTMIGGRSSSGSKVAKLPGGILRRCETYVNLCLLLHYKGAAIYKVFDRVNMFSNLDNLKTCELQAFGRSGVLLSVIHEKKTVVGRGRNMKNSKFISALKFSVINQEQDPDNLLYEAFIGKEIINQFAIRFPLFVQTYHLYHLLSRRDVWLINQYAYVYLTSLSTGKRMELFPDDPVEYFTIPQLENAVINEKNQIGPEATDGFINARVLKRMFQLKHRAELVSTMLEDESLRAFKTACRDSRQLVMQTEFIENAVTLMQFLLDEFGPEGPNNAFFWNFECASILFQLYGPLSCIRKEFTHYDAHLNNLIVAKLDRRHIVLRYHYKGKIIRIASKYILKMIDYGRSFTKKTTEFQEALCKVCKPNCGKNSGFHYINQREVDAKQEKTYIRPTHHNISHDLRAAYLIRNLILEKEPDVNKQQFDRNDFPGKAIRNLLRNIHFEEFFGTPERETMPHFDPQQALLQTGNANHKIRNVHDLFESVFIYCASRSFEQHLSIFEHLSKSIGQMDIYLDESQKPLTFTPSHG